LNDRTILWNVRVVVGDGSPPAERMAVTAAGGRIESIGPIGDSSPPPGSIDADGRTLLPGLIDAHVHLSSDTSRSPGFGPPPHLHGEEPRRRELGYFVLARTATALLAAGLTTVRDVGSYDD
jgi:imidazolonepropionase-like amidohydrolase